MSSADEAGPAAAPPRIRWATPADVPEIVTMVAELAAYERAADEARMSVEQLRAALFGERRALYGHVAVDDNDRPIGFALWFLNFSTWAGSHGIYLEDLYVRPEQRGTGLGRALLQTLAALCVERGYARLEWWVLDWNAPAIEFYRRAGARPMQGWTVYRLDDAALLAMGRWR